MQPEDGRFRHDLAVRSGVDWNDRLPPKSDHQTDITRFRLRGARDDRSPRHPHRRLLLGHHLAEPALGPAPRGSKLEIRPRADQRSRSRRRRHGTCVFICARRPQPLYQLSL